MCQNYKCNQQNGQPLTTNQSFQEIDHRKAILFPPAGWSIIPGFGYLTLFSAISANRTISLVFCRWPPSFSLTNVLLTLIPRRQLLRKRVPARESLAGLRIRFHDVFYLLRHPETYLFLPGVSCRVPCFAVVWRDLRLWLFLPCLL